MESEKEINTNENINSGRSHMVDWRKISKIDAHIHLTPKVVIDANEDYDGRFIVNGSIDDYEELMKTNNIESAFIMPFNDPYMLSMEFTVEAVNENMKEMISGRKNRFYCFADIDIRKDIKDMLLELDKVFMQKEFIGIKLHPSNTGYPIDGTYYEQIIKYANDNNVLVEIHSYPRENLPDDVCSPVRIRNVVSKYPNLRLSIAHLGGFQYKELLGLNAYFNLSAILPDLVNRIGVEKTNEVLRSFGVENLIFATDYPDSRSIDANKIYDVYYDILGKMDFTQEEAENICKYNALRMLDSIRELS
jgi:predicted TIM-barrel fold metal-dependent hydrolase